MHKEIFIMNNLLCRAALSIFLASSSMHSAEARADNASPGTAEAPMVSAGDTLAQENHEVNSHANHHTSRPNHNTEHAHKLKHGTDPKYKTLHYTPYGGRWGVRADLLGALALTLRLGDFTQGKSLLDGIKASGNIALPVRVSGTYGVTDALELFLTLGTAQKLATIAGDNIPFGLLYSIGFGVRYYINTDDPVKAFVAPAIHVGYGNGVSVGLEMQSGLQFQLIDELAMALQTGMILCPASFASLNMIQLAPYAGIGFHYHF
jgi:hypothetical protein